jgi:hypothetical protein
MGCFVTHLKYIRLELGSNESILHGNGRWRIQWDAGILKMHAIDENLGINHDNGGMALFGSG